MCTYQTETLEVSGSGKGAEGWFPLTHTTVYFDHPVHATADHTLNVDLLNPEPRRQCPRRHRARPQRRPGARGRHFGHARLGASSAAEPDGELTLHGGDRTTAPTGSSHQLACHTDPVAAGLLEGDRPRPCAAIQLPRPLSSASD